MTLQTAALDGGFKEPVHNAQVIFRALMAAMACPGTIETSKIDAESPFPLGPAQGAIALTLLDADTAAWFSPRLAIAPVTGWIAFHTGAELVTAPAHARFAFLAAGEPMPDLSGFALGSQDYPDRSATLVVELPSLAGGRPMKARGPGIKGSTTLSPQGLPEDFCRRWNANRGLYPRGIDLVLTAGSSLMALPRSVQLEPMEA